ncbi:hypothetical protein SOVF_013200 isoform A [Spinacia oleracea]|uniref:Uncharacterized protein At1g65710 isoform X2 n=1 Tax=Spinacia oleracea TaxID=3562 RepID=A0A9R0KDD4_SPIOL|nr:uncharacterized protein At1g65710-like isoform X2 [Spinacia oleracea]KNA24738.1 hypothetical protein SOVF_013200 isoform A [Spinacia oleracea]
MGCCLSKKDPCSKSVLSNSQIQQNDPKNTQNLTVPVKLEQAKTQVATALETKPEPKAEQERESEGSETYSKKKKEVFVIQHRKSNDRRPAGPDSDGSASITTESSEPSRETEEIGRNILAAAASGQVVRTSSCTKEEVDAILIQCGRLSRSSSGKGVVNAGHGRRYSGSKRSFDFDRENDSVDESKRKGNGNEELIEGLNNDEDERSRRRHSRGSNRRRTTPSRSREREQQQQQQQRSGSRERSQSNGRRVSRSPGRRSESPMTHSNGNVNGSVRPGKLVSVPATVTSLSVEKGSNGNAGDGGNGNGNVKRVLVKRNVGSPRSQSPARAHSPVRGVNQGNGNGQQQQQPVAVSLSRNGSRKAEHSPYRRTPLNEIDINSLPFHPLSNKRAVTKGKEIEEDVVVVKQPINSGFQNKYAETNNIKVSGQGSHRRSSSRGADGYEVTKTNYCRVNEIPTPNVEQMSEGKGGQLDASEYDAMLAPVETLKIPQTLMRSRSARRSRDLDISVEALLAPANDYNSLLLQDIQNFHQKKSSNANAVNSNIDVPLTLPPCVSKACSIVEAVADLNSMTGSGSDDRRKTPRETNFSLKTNGNKRAVESKDPFVESEVKVGDDLMEPSLHKYVTVRMKGGDFDDEESSGSNSYVGGSQHNWVSSSSWEPTSADSTDCWTSKSYSRDELSPVVGFQRHAISEYAGVINEESERKFSKGGSARVRTIAGKGPIPSTSKAAAASM